MSSPISSAIKQICDEKGIDESIVLETIEAALAAAYRKDFGEKNQNIKTQFKPETGEIRVFEVKEVVEDALKEEWEQAKLEREKARETGNELTEPVSAEAAGEDKEAKDETRGDENEEDKKKRYNPYNHISLSEAREIKKDIQIGEEIVTELNVPGEFGRMAAQTAKQVIIQKLREAERNTIFEDFKDKEGELLNGVAQRRLGRDILVDLGKASGILPQEEQVMGERYMPGDRIKVYVISVTQSVKGPEIKLSRIHPEILRILFTIEVPEISNGLIEIKSIAREAGSRSKMAVLSLEENIDPIGSCVGQRGARIQTVISELGGEKVDIIEYSDDTAKFVANALSPAKVLSVEVDEKEHKTKVKVVDDQLSLAIGKAGQNVRLAAKLTGWKIDIAGEAGVVTSADEEGNVEGDGVETKTDSSTAEVAAETGITDGTKEEVEEEDKKIEKVVEEKEVKKEKKEAKATKTKETKKEE